MDPAPLLTWTPSLSVGIPALDAQHQEIFARVAALDAALCSGASDAELGDLLAWLKRYTLDHFEAEERIMRRVGYPGLAAHAGEHGDFRRKAEMLERLHEVEGASVAMAGLLVSLVRTWLVEHIGSADQAIGEHIRRRGGTAPG